MNRPRNGAMSWCLFCRRLLWSGAGHVSFHCFGSGRDGRNGYAHKTCHERWQNSYRPEYRTKGTFPQPAPTHFPKVYKIAVFFDEILPRVMRMKNRKKSRRLK